MSKEQNFNTESIRKACTIAYEAYDKGDFKRALRIFYQAWLSLPKPQTDLEQAGWVLTGIGDTYFRLHQYLQGCEALKSAQHCPGMSNNPFVHLRKGQCLYHLGERIPARQELKKAYDIAGAKIFVNEKDTYLNLIRDLT